MYAVIMAGGRGVRFWPKSREARPKHLLNILSGDRTILQETVDRVSSLVERERTFVVTGRGHAREVLQQLPQLPPGNIIVEPVGRNTAPCIGLAALHIAKADPEAVMVVLPSDHYIGDVTEFIRVLSAAAGMAKRGPYLVTVGVKPTHPETGYGYVERGEEIATLEGRAFYRVRSFREKPARKDAETFVRDGGFSWNSGVFLWRASTVLATVEKFLPELHEGLRRIAGVLDTPQEDSVVSEVYQAIRPVSVDYGIMEKYRDVILVNGDFGWSDVGSWDALWDVLEKDKDGNALTGTCIAENSRNSLVYSPGKLVALLGVEDLIIVESEDALLVCKRGASQEVRRIVEILEKRKMVSYL